MQSVNMLQAKSSLSRLVDAIESGRERERRSCALALHA